ncbi:putative dsDNA-dependent ATPase [Aspergillus campestris IBT 28561]|uniref:DsDNA-dependent ATPase n=1 Tax=Aspergillus campestris (strain IBT 28561) TaxID=1392248 RepID=A0A2I1DGU7_ASPC2|nr:putative dsDNA-dependent ATPase [Aspergillus campestris IBT 28561]PKY09091.1 putative dsDNA-dependent ATPase [Aspergillus campestris IBT 28561]
MVFKPFKPPLMRKPTVPSTTDTTDGPADPAPPPSKKPRLSDEHKQPATETSRKPLVQVRNVREHHHDYPVKDKNKEKDNSVDLTDDRYFNALWRKPTTKKNKTWDGDGVLSARDGYVYLQDVSGKEMGRAMIGARLEQGVMLSIGGKEVEVDEEIPREEYLSGKRFLGGREAKPSPSVSSSTSLVGKGPASVSAKRTAGSTGETKLPRAGAIATVPNPASLGRPGARLGAYKRPLWEGAPLAQNTASTAEPIPRHDPKQPGALVMKRPASAPKGKQIVDVVVDPILVKHLRPHQREGVQFLYECVMGLRPFNGEGAILADDMGLGKTLQTIALLWTLLKQNPIYESGPVVKKALIVCPVTLINNWRKEFKKWLGNERIGVFVYDDNRKRITDFTMGKAYNVMIVGYEKLRTLQENLTRGAGVDIIIADEGHRLKTLQNKSGMAIQSLNANKRVILSGTPIQNDLREFFAAVELVNPGVLGTFKAFVREFEGPIVRSRQPEATRKDIEKGESRNEELRELTSKFMLRRTAEILAEYLPPKSEYVLFCTPTSTQANIYRHVLASPVFQYAIGNSENALQLITILKKLCNSPSLLTPKSATEAPSETISALLSSLPPNLLRHFSPSASAKIRVLDQFLYNLRNTTSEKVVLVSNYTSTLNLLATLLTALSLPFLRLDGSTPAQKRQSLVEDFNRHPPDLCFAFLLSAKAGGTGLNLIGASRLVLFDVDWNPATDIQAMARIHRDGQKRHCRIYRILLKGSLEEKIWQRQVTKLGLADSVMEKKNTAAQFSRNELKDLFRLDQESRCQTHELLGCECNGTGRVGLPPSDGPLSDDKKDDDDEDEEEDFPDLPTLIKASQVDMDQQEKQIRSRQRGRRSRQITTISSSSDNEETEDGQLQNMHQSLAQYAHIDPCLLSGNEGESIQQSIDDDVLLSVLRDEDNRVGYIFKKTSAGEAKVDA